MNSLVLKLRKETLWAFQLPQDIEVSDWADQYRILDARTSAESGRWRTARTPYLKGIMDALNDPYVRSITIKASTQIGKTESLINMLGFCIDQDPGPTLWVHPIESLAREFCAERLQPMIQLSEQVAKHLTKYSDDMTKRGIAFDRMKLHIGWSNSPAILSSRPIKYVFLDEVDKYPKFSGREADPIKLATERTRTFGNHKIVKCSTPTTPEGYIFQDYEKTDKCQYHVPCPNCGEYQPLVFPQIMWPEEERSQEKIRDQRLAYYVCQYCEGQITDNMKFQMLAKGEWVPEHGEVTKKGQRFFKGKRVKVFPAITRKGFWINALYSPWLTFSDIAAEFLSSKDQINDLMNFVNSWLAEPWVEKTKETGIEDVRALARDYPEGLLPDKVLVLTAGVDVQKDHFYGVIRGWGVEEHSWLIRAFRAESWAEVLNTLFNTEYPKADGHSRLRVRLACIDSGYRTDEVYEVARRYRECARAIKGDDRVSGIPFKVAKIDRLPRSGAIIKGGLSLWRLDTNYFKDKVHRLVHSGDYGPQKWNLFANPPIEYFKQFCSEDKVIIRDRNTGRSQEVWKKKSENAPNHFWDCENYAVAAAEMLRISALREAGQATVYRPRRILSEGGSPYGTGLGRRQRGWLNR